MPRVPFVAVARALFLVIALLLTTPTRATILTITQTGTGSGTLAGVPFPASAFTITSIVDTANRETSGGVITIPTTSASISISGVGILDFLSPTSVFVNSNIGAMGISRALPDVYDLFDMDGPVAELLTWDMLGPIGPITADGDLLQWNSPYPPVSTSGGVLAFTGANTPMTLTAVPEPASFLILAVGALMIGRRPKLC